MPPIYIYIGLERQTFMMEGGVSITLCAKTSCAKTSRTACSCANGCAVDRCPGMLCFLRLSACGPLGLGSCKAFTCLAVDHTGWPLIGLIGPSAIICLLFGHLLSFACLASTERLAFHWLVNPDEHHVQYYPLFESIW
ncbi:hypothetical protein RF11_07252 [Thelohanellus kitauei]|uniref:Uncharacterized protein n=1 Tax=Thelohanellus kitauei TaxID=669202 RepID=A0A0C2N6Z9_THEKT|nr:hypothetical protein RF11_07252 [Thelohanellus kitauei]